MKRTVNNDEYTAVGQEILAKFNESFVESFIKIYENKEQLSAKDWNSIVSEYKNATAMVTDLHLQHTANTHEKDKGITAQNISRSTVMQTKLDFERDM